jgi:uncharacterized repeat protein (TIGR03943 family)
MSSSTFARALVLALWSGFFAYLWVSQEMVRYLGPRTYWVVPFGCITLGAAAGAHLTTLWRARGGSKGTGRRMSRSDAFGIGVLLIPIVAVIAVPHAELGALAVSRKATGAGATSALAAPTASDRRSPPSFIDVHHANESEEYARALGVADGTELSLTGFVSESHGPQEFVITRFYVSCCAADAIPYSVTVLAEQSRAGFADNTWLRVNGVLRNDGNELKLVAESLEEIEQPDSPYLY